MRYVFLVLFLCMVGCGSQQNSSGLNGIGHGGSEKNIALLFGAPNGLAGVPTDITKLTELFAKPEYNFMFEVRSDNTATVADIVTMTKAAAEEADSIFWYFSGHGNRGTMMADDRDFGFSEVAAAIKEVRGADRPLKRLLVFIDSCFSGSFVNGGSPIIDENGVIVAIELSSEEHQAWAQEAVYDVFSDSALYEQAFVMSAASKDETSLDLGRDRGGSFTYTLRTDLAKLYEENSLSTIDDMAKKVTEDTKQEYDHTPQYKAFPADEVLSDYLFLYRSIQD